MDDKELKRLLAKYKEETCTPEEKALLENWVASVTYPEYQITEQELAQDLSAIGKHLPLAHKQTYRLWPRVASVAAAVAAVVFGIWFFNHNVPEMNLGQVNDLAANHDIAPGKNTATLTLASGKVINLSDAKTGVVIGADRLAYNDGSLVQKASVTSVGVAEQLMASTPRGGTYTVTLPDGTKVWLNAASSLTFPSHFANVTERKVELSGEAYFEVFKNKRLPFIVESKTQRVEVLGTHFNVNAYADEAAVKTTLLEGSVLVGKKGFVDPKDPWPLPYPPVILKPNEQAVVQGKTTVVKKVDAAEAIDWKNGLFVFENEQLESIMRKIGRWYNVTVVYDDPGIASQTFTGTVTRFGKISIVLKRLEVTGSVKFKLEGNKIIISKKT